MQIVKTKTFFLVSFLLLINLLFAFVSGSITDKTASEPSITIKGITVVAPPKAIGAPAFKRLKDKYRMGVICAIWFYKKRGK